MTVRVSTIKAKNPKRIRLLQLSDPHLFANTDRIFAGINPYKSFQAILDDVQDHAPFDCVLTTGDIAQEVILDPYLLYLEQIKKIKAPHFWLRGNHDEHPDLCCHLQFHEPQVVLLGSWCLILLDSSVENAVYGHIDQHQLALLPELLQQYADYHVIVALHHHIFPVQSDWIDQHCLKNSADLLSILTRAPQVRAVIFGHIHQVYEQVYHNIHFYSCPSTSIQFKPFSHQFQLDDIPPGYRMFELYDDGKITTQVRRLPHTIGEINRDFAGY